METKGIEQAPLALSKTAISEPACAKSGAPDAPDTPADPDLARLIELWPILPETVRAEILRVAGFTPNHIAEDSP